MRKKRAQNKFNCTYVVILLAKRSSDLEKIDANGNAIQSKQ